METPQHEENDPLAAIDYPFFSDSLRRTSSSTRLSEDPPPRPEKPTSLFVDGPRVSDSDEDNEDPPPRPDLPWYLLPEFLDERVPQDDEEAPIPPERPSNLFTHDVVSSANGDDEVAPPKPIRPWNLFISEKGIHYEDENCVVLPHRPQKPVQLFSTAEYPPRPRSLSHGSETRRSRGLRRHLRALIPKGNDKSSRPQAHANKPRATSIDAQSSDQGSAAGASHRRARSIGSRFSTPLRGSIGQRANRIFRTRRNTDEEVSPPMLPPKPSDNEPGSTIVFVGQSLPPRPGEIDELFNTSEFLPREGSTVLDALAHDEVEEDEDSDHPVANVALHPAHSHPPPFAQEASERTILRAGETEVAMELESNLDIVE